MEQHCYEVALGQGSLFLPRQLCSDLLRSSPVCSALHQQDIFGVTAPAGEMQSSGFGGKGKCAL